MLPHPVDQVVDRGVSEPGDHVLGHDRLDRDRVGHGADGSPCERDDFGSCPCPFPCPFPFPTHRQGCGEPGWLRRVLRGARVSRFCTMPLSIRTVANIYLRPSAAVGPSAAPSAVLASTVAAHSVADRSASRSKRAFWLGLSSPAPSARFNTIDSAARCSLAVVVARSDRGRPPVRRLRRPRGYAERPMRLRRSCRT